MVPSSTCSGGSDDTSNCEAVDRIGGNVLDDVGFPNPRLLNDEDSFENPFFSELPPPFIPPPLPDSAVTKLLADEGVVA